MCKRLKIDKSKMFCLHLGLFCLREKSHKSPRECWFMFDMYHYTHFLHATFRLILKHHFSAAPIRRKSLCLGPVSAYTIQADANERWSEQDVELLSESSVYLFWHRQAIFLSYVLVLGWATPTRQTGSVYPFIPLEWGGVCPTTSSLDGEDSWMTVSSGIPGGPRRSE